MNKDLCTAVMRMNIFQITATSGHPDSPQARLYYTDQALLNAFMAKNRTEKLTVVEAIVEDECYYVAGVRVHVDLEYIMVPIFRVVVGQNGSAREHFFLDEEQAKHFTDCIFKSATFAKCESLFAEERGDGLFLADGRVLEFYGEDEVLAE